MKVADDIIAAVCAERGICMEQLLQSGMRTRGVSAARRAVITRLTEHHFSAQWIANKLGVSLNSVNYHIYPSVRARVQRNYEKVLARTRAAREAVQL